MEKIRVKCLKCGLEEEVYVKNPNANTYSQWCPRCSAHEYAPGYDQDLVRKWKRV